MPTHSSGRIASGSLAAAAAQVLYLGTRFLLTPFVVVQAGYAAYGFWSVLFVALGWFGVHRMGFTSASITFAARHLAAGRTSAASAVLRTTSTLALAFAAVVGGAAVLGAPLLVDVLGTDAGMRSDALLALRVTVVATFASLVLGGWQSALEAVQEYPRVKLVDACAQLVEAALVVLLLSNGLGLVGLAGAYAVRLLLPVPVLARLARRRIPGIRVLPGRPDRETLRQVLGFGGSVQLLGLVHLAVASIDRIVLTTLLGLPAAGAYEVARKLVSFAAALPAHALAPLVPAASAAMSSPEGRRAVAPLLRTATRFVTTAAAMPLAAFVACAAPLVHAWLGEPQPEIATAIQVLSFGAFVHLATGPATAVLRGLARPGLELLYAGVWLLAGVPFMWTGAELAGLPGVAAGSALAQALASTLLLLLALPRLGVERRALLRDAFGPALASFPGAVVVALVAAAATTRAEAISVCLAAGVLSALSTSYLVHRFVLDAAERRRLSELAAQAVDRVPLLRRVPWLRRRPLASEIVR